VRRPTRLASSRAPVWCTSRSGRRFLAGCRTTWRHRGTTPGTANSSVPSNTPPVSPRSSGWAPASATSVLGRFLEVDPIEGGTPNDYVYPTDPVNQTDLTGKWVAGFCRGFSVVPLFGFTVTQCHVFDGQGNVGVSVSSGWAYGLSADAQGSLLWSSASTIGGLEGVDKCASLSLGLTQGVGAS